MTCTVHTNVNSEDEDLGKLAEALWNFAHGNAKPFEWTSSDGALTVEGRWEHVSAGRDLQVVTFTDEMGACSCPPSTT